MKKAFKFQNSQVLALCFYTLEAILPGEAVIIAFPILLNTKWQFYIEEGKTHSRKEKKLQFKEENKSFLPLMLMVESNGEKV